MQSRELIFLKPNDAIKRKLVGKIITRFEESGFNIIRMRKSRISKELAVLLYPDSETQLTGMGNKTIESMSKKVGADAVKKQFGTMDPYKIGIKLNEWNREYASSDDVIACILEGEDAPTRARALIGKTDPALADKGTIRGDFGNDSIYQANLEMRACKNLVHASDAERAEVEIGYFEKYFF